MVKEEVAVSHSLCSSAVLEACSEEEARAVTRMIPMHRELISQDIQALELQATSLPHLISCFFFVNHNTRGDDGTMKRLHLSMKKNKRNMNQALVA